MTETEPSAAEMPTVTSRLMFCLFAFCTFAVYIGLDLLTPSCFYDPMPAIFLMILLVGQLTLICVWGTLVEGTFWVRLPWTILLLVISWAALCYGVFIDKGYIPPAEVMGMGVVWFYGFLISYIPIKIAAWAFGWRISLTSKREAAEASGRYAIRDIMIGTAILALTLSIGRHFVPGEWPRWSEVVEASGLDRSEPFVAFLVFSVISLIVKLPCIWIALASSRSKILGQSVIWFFCAGGLGILETVILFAMLGSTPKLFDIMGALVLGHSLMAASMIAVLYCLRCFGYRMSRKKKSTLATLVDS